MRWPRGARYRGADVQYSIRGTRGSQAGERGVPWHGHSMAASASPCRPSQIDVPLDRSRPRE